jgi:hypothetical protein
MRLSAPVVPLAFVAAVIAACGGSKPAATSPEPPAATAPTASSATSASTPEPSAAPEPSASPAAPKASLDSQREDFMRACMHKVSAPDYCECGFEEFKAVFKDADLTKGLSDADPRFKELTVRTQAQCASKLTEDAVKPNFLKGCTSDDPRRNAYCSCAWTSMRKTLSIGDFLRTEELGSRFEDAKRAMVKACRGKFPADVAKGEFSAACRKGSSPKACDCLWKKIRAKFSVEEIAAGTADVKSVPGLSDCQRR